MQITRCEVIPLELKLHRPTQTIGLNGASTTIHTVTAIFVRLETRGGQSAWGCTVAHPQLNASLPNETLHACKECAARAVDLHPMNVEYALAELTPVAAGSDAALCAFDLAFHDLLCLAASMPLYRLLGGYRNSIRTSITIPLGDVDDCVAAAKEQAARGFRILKIKGGLDPDLDVRRVRAVRRALPEAVLRLDADGGYDVRRALDVARALEGRLEMLEQPTPPDNLDALAQVTRHSPVPVLADQSACGPASALQIASGMCADGLSVKVAACGGLRAARQVDAIARAARLATMVGCLVEPAMLIAAGLSFALSSPNVRYGDLDGHLHLLNDPSVPGFRLEDGMLIASEVPGLGYSVNLGS